MTPVKTKPPRAPRGSVEASQLVGMSQDLFDRATASAKTEGVSVAEWWRRAGEDRLWCRGSADSKVTSAEIERWKAVAFQGSLSKSKLVVGSTITLNGVAFKVKR